MPELEEISYSREEIVAAFRDYYTFLTKMYLKESDVLEPPASGWPEFDSAILKRMGKSEGVIELLRHLPYVENRGNDSALEAAPWATMMDWQYACRFLPAEIIETEAEMYKLDTEGDRGDAVPDSVIGLTEGGQDKEVFLLDINQGTIYWPECDGKIKYFPTFPMVEDDPKLIGEMRQAGQSNHEISSNYGRERPGEAGLRPMLQKIYQEHGWPDLTRYRKEECLAALQEALIEHFPERADRDLLDDEEAQALDQRIKVAQEELDLELYGRSAAD